jgi:hypothetical protein
MIDYDCIKFSDPFVLLSFNSSSNLYRHWKFIIPFIKHNSGLCPNRVSFSKAPALPRGWFIVVDHVRVTRSFPWDYCALHMVQKKRLELSYNPFDR